MSQDAIQSLRDLSFKLERYNPSPAGASVIIRDHNCSVISTIAIGLGSCSNFIAEVNFAADALANKGSSHPPGHVMYSNVRPANLSIENQDLTYYRFK
ncbi:hypothetical protein BVC80_1309g19 [Macleaya cordata]|uniref:Uncharacterized protein n=1 Tax=Macleaya cordata TaxID=56857 RepID=A0A200R398_MACCD|nr:hypothetical protein BVC80_1309g19 [Macleaya cordata]